MGASTPSNDYALGSSDPEYARLVRQGRMLAACTRRAFLDAGLIPGQRVLDVGSGVGDVALLAAAIVGPTGSVLGVDRDERALAKARERVQAESVTNVRFSSVDLADPSIEGTFDAIVGRFVLMFLADPVATLQRLVALLSPGGILVFQEASWASFFPLATHLPLHTQCGELLCEVLRRTGAQPDMPTALYKGFAATALTETRLRVDVILATQAEDRRWVADLLATVRPRIDELRIPLDGVGDLDTVAARLEMEFAAAKSYVPFVGLVAGAARKPILSKSRT